MSRSELPDRDSFNSLSKLSGQPAEDEPRPPQKLSPDIPSIVAIVCLLAAGALGLWMGWPK